MSYDLTALVAKGLFDLYGKEIDQSQIQLQKTRKEFEGDVTMVVFPFLRISGKGPELTATELGEHLVASIDHLQKFNVVKGFLNLSFTDQYWYEQLRSTVEHPDFGTFPEGDHSRNVMVEYSSPNTNKPLHLGHVRNILLGYSVAEILKANGHRVRKVQIVNDRGIHICKSMLAWQKWGNGETPESAGIKGDKLVGNYYVLFDQKYKEEITRLTDEGLSKEEAEKASTLMDEARKMLIDWEAEDKEIRTLWKKMNGWVYDGFDVTYDRLGVDFDKLYYESETFITGKRMVEEGLAKNLFFQKEDGSVWVDLSDSKMDPKLLLRADGTTVYMTQDMGTAKQRVEDWPQLDQLIYTVGNEQDHHFKVLFNILGKLGFGWANDCYHLSYGMVTLPQGMGRMKSREGTVVDADDLMQEMHDQAEAQSKDRGKLDLLSHSEANELFEMLGMGALKYFILRVDPRKNMVFDPNESIDMQGNTGPFIQYTHARISSILRKANEPQVMEVCPGLEAKERDLIRTLTTYPEVVKQAGADYDPAAVANYTYELSKEFNQFYHDHPILKEEDQEKRRLRLVITSQAAMVLKKAMNLLGIEVPERM